MPAAEVKGLEQSSAEVKEGVVFFAVKGSRVDGHTFIEDAVKNGAVAVVGTEPAGKDYGVPYIRVKDIDAAMADAAAAFYDNPSKDMFVIGVTGTKGKTSITYFLESIFNAAGVPNSVIGTINYRINGRVLSAAPNTTPAALALYKMLAEMREKGSKVLVMEVSSHALSLKRVRGVEYNAALFANLQRDHLDFHENFENYFNAKKILFSDIVKNGKKDKFIVVNTDDPYGRRLEEEFSRQVKTESVSLKEASAVKSSLDGVEFVYKKTNFKTNLLGEHNVYNALFAIKTAEEYGISLDAAAKGLAALRGIPGRMERVDKGQSFYAYVDFAYTEESLKKAYETVLPYKKGRIITVFGCGGERDRTKRPLMGRAACINSDVVFLTDDNPRREDPQQIFKDILQGMEECKNYTLIPDRKEAIFSAVKECRAGDILLVTGKGHEEYQITGVKKEHFSDKEVIESALGS